MRVIHFGVMALTLSVLAVILTGCSSFLTNPKPQSSELEWSEGWVISQGEEPQVCEQEISRQEARKEAQEALKTEEEAQKLQQTLASLGKRLMVWRAQGCEVRKEEENNSSSQGLRALSQEDETILVEVPAGADAALYLLEDESAGEGNYWASLKESLPGGERLTHIEVGLEEEAGVQGLSEGVGKISFFLPDEEGTEEVAQQVQNLLQGDSGTSGAGVSGMQVEGFDWANAEVLLLDDTSEEQEAILVVPSQGAVGQRLWGRGRPPIDEDQAIFARVKVKKTISQGSSRPALQVTAPPTQMKKGSELRPASKYCPYRYYGRLSSFRRAFCHGYQPPWTLERASRRITSVQQKLGESGFNGDILSFAGKEVSLIAVGFKGLTSERLSQLYQQAKQIGLAAAQDVIVDAQQQEPLHQGCLAQPGWVDTARALCDNIATLIGLISGKAGEAAKGVCMTLSKVLEWWQSLKDKQRQHATAKLQELTSFANDPTRFRDHYQWLRENDPLMKEFFSYVEEALSKAGMSLDMEPLRRAALNSTIWAYNEAGIVLYILMEKYLAQNPSSPLSTFLQQIDELNRLMPTLRCEIYRMMGLISAALAEVLAGDQGAEEFLARAQYTVRLAMDLRGRGWSVQRIFMPCPEHPPMKAICDLVVVGYSDHPDFNRQPIVAIILVEPYLGHNEAAWAQREGFTGALISRIEAAALALRQMGIGVGSQAWGYWQVVIVVIHNSYPGAVDRLCTNLNLLPWGEITLPDITVIIVQNGQIVCRHRGSTYPGDEAIDQMCIEMGLCRPGGGPPEEITPDDSSNGDLTIHQPILPGGCAARVKCRLQQLVF